PTPHTPHPTPHTPHPTPHTPHPTPPNTTPGRGSLDALLTPKKPKKPRRNPQPETRIPNPRCQPHPDPQPC
ncbi:hypothetical protein T484DRAFT_1648393, partial [Baffinella frigidus]